MFFIILTRLCNHHHHLIPEHSITLKRSIPWPWQPLTYLLSLWICLFYIFHRSGTMQYLSFCVWLSVFKVYPCCRMCQNFIPFYGWIILHFRFTVPLEFPWHYSVYLFNILGLYIHGGMFPCNLYWLPVSLPTLCLSLWNLGSSCGINCRMTAAFLKLAVAAWFSTDQKLPHDSRVWQTVPSWLS